MPAPNVQLNITVAFNSMHDLMAFKNECACKDFYIDRDELTLVGSFSDEQLDLATNKYHAVYHIVSE